MRNAELETFLAFPGIPSGFRIPNSAFRTLLWPLARVWSVGARARVALYQGGFLRRYRLEKPVVSVGNLSVGGTGKTPFVLWLWRELEGHGLHASVLTRGHRRPDRREPLIFEGPEGSDGAGEEARLLLRSGVHPVGVAARRALAGAAVESGHPVDLHLLDDGFQHLSLSRALDIVLLDCTRPPWEYDLLPAGRLREPLSALARAGVVVLTRAYPWTPVEEFERLARDYNRHALVAKAVTEVTGLDQVTGPVFAFAGIGNPKAFFDDLGRAGSRTGMEVAGTLAFPDHHRYSAADLERIRQRARRAGAKALVTTEKDSLNLSNAECGVRNAELEKHSALRIPHSALPLLVAGMKLLVDGGREVVKRVIGVAGRRSS